MCHSERGTFDPLLLALPIFQEKPDKVDFM